MLRTSLAILLLAAGCASSAPASGPDAGASVPPEAVSEEVRLEVGGAVTRGGQTLAFVGVAEDSRCPEDVECVWAGRATVNVEVDGEPFALTLSYTGQQPEEISTVMWDGTTVRFTALTPYPGSEADRSGEAVTATFTPQAP